MFATKGLQKTQLIHRNEQKTVLEALLTMYNFRFNFYICVLKKVKKFQFHLGFVYEP